MSRPARHVRVTPDQAATLAADRRLVVVEPVADHGDPIGLGDAVVLHERAPGAKREKGTQRTQIAALRQTEDRSPGGHLLVSLVLTPDDDPNGVQ